ncbi:MAG: dipicolinate synthase subunit DpsA [Eubacteriales bacterium]
MKNNIKIALLGGDARQHYLSAMLAEQGYECAVWGMGDGNIGKAVRCREVKCAITGASAIVLPLPASSDGSTVNCPLANSDEKVKLTYLLDNVSVPIFAGKPGETFINLAKEKGKHVIDYFESESMQIRNAVPTAEGAISIAMQYMKRTVCGCRAGVVGYGRIGKMLSHLLLRMGAHVTVAARNCRQLSEASSYGCSVVRLSAEAPLGGLEKLAFGYDVIFNTVPYRLFDRKVISKLSPDTLMIDLASVPGGVDFLAAKERGINAVWALSLPGKYAPESAGRIIGETLLEYFEREGIT